MLCNHQSRTEDKAANAGSYCSARDVEDSSHSTWLASTGAHANDCHTSHANATSCLQRQPKCSSNTTECLGHRRAGVQRCLPMSAFKLRAIELAKCTWSTVKLSILEDRTGCCCLCCLANTGPSFGPVQLDIQKHVLNYKKVLNVQTCFERSNMFGHPKMFGRPTSFGRPKIFGRPKSFGRPRICTISSCSSRWIRTIC